MRVLHVNFAKGFRGGERQTGLLIRALANKNVEQGLLLRHDSSLIAELADLALLEIIIVRKPYMKRLVKLCEYDIVQAHETKAAQWAYLNFKRCGMPYVISRRIPKVPKNNNFTRAVYSNASLSICLSAEILDNLLLTVPKAKTLKIADMCSDLLVDYTLLASLQKKYAGKLIIGNVGALIKKHKGQHILLEAARQLQHRSNLHFLILGEGYDRFDLEQQSEDLKNVEFLGFQQTIGTYLHLFDVFVFPSLEEGMGSTLLDVMQAEKPIVASNVGGIPEIIENERDGLLVVPGDSISLRMAIERILDSHSLSISLIRSAVIKVNLFKPHIIAAKYLLAYKQILSDGVVRNLLPTVAHVNFSKDFRGGERQMELLIRELAKRGYRQKLLVCKHSLLAVKLQGLQNLECIEVGKLYWIMTLADVDWIHVYEAKASLWAWLNYRRTRTPYIITCRVVKVLKYSVLTRAVYMQAKHVICMSQVIFQTIYSFVPSTRLSVIGDMFADLDGQAFRTLQIKKEYLSKVVVGQIEVLSVKDKGSHIVIDAFKFLPEDKFTLLLLGGGLNHTHLKYKAQGMDNVEFLGLQEDISSYIYALDLLILPSIMEGFGSLILAAMHAGVPIIVSKVGGGLELIKHKQNGLLCETESVESLVESILLLSQNNGFRETLVHNARQDVLMYTPEKIADKYISLYLNRLPKRIG